MNTSDDHLGDDSDLADAISEIAAFFNTPVDPAVSQNHLVAMFDAADEFITSHAPIGSAPPVTHRRKPVLKTLTAGLVFKIGLGVGATALAATSGVALVSNLGDSSPKPTTVSTATAGDRDLGAIELAAAAGKAQSDYQAACVQRMQNLSSKMSEIMDRFAAEHPELAAQMPDMSIDAPESACTFDWKTLVGDACATEAAKHPDPPAGVLEAMPEGLRAIVADPCNADWANVDWAGVMKDFDPSALVKAACANHAETSEGLGFKKFCESDFNFDFDLSKFPDVSQLDALTVSFGSLHAIFGTSAQSLSRS